MTSARLPSDAPRPKGTGVDVVGGLRGHGPRNRASIRSRFMLTRIARGLPGLETKHAYGRRARNAHCFQRDCKLSRIGPLLRRPPRHQRRPFRRVSVGVHAFELRHVMPGAGAFDRGRRRTDAMRDRPNPRRRERKDCRAIFAPCEVARPSIVRNPARTEAAGSSVMSVEAAIERSSPGRSRYGSTPATTTSTASLSACQGSPLADRSTPRSQNESMT